MLEKLSYRITDYFIKRGIIKVGETDIYRYCFELMLSTVINLIGIIVIACVTKTYLESLMFSICFMAMRGTAGGFHSKTHIGCFISLMLFYGAMLVLLKTADSRILFYVSTALLPFSAIAVVLLSPVESKNKPLSIMEFKTQRKKSIIYLIIIIAATSVLLLFGYTRTIAFSAAFATGSVAILLIVGFIKNSVEKKLLDHEIKIFKP